MTAQTPGSLNTGLLTAPELRIWILKRLGAPIIEVELDEQLLDTCIDDARHWFAAKKGVIRVWEFYAQPNQSEYQLPDDVNTVTEVAFTESALDLSLSMAPGFFLPDQQIPYHALAAPNSGGLYSSYVQSLQYIEMGKRILGIELDWSQDGRILRLHPLPKTNGKVIVHYTSRRFTVEQLQERDHEILKRYALALAKGILGLIRSKRDALGAQGTVKLDGPELREASEKEIEALNEEIALSAGPMGFLTA